MKFSYKKRQSMLYERQSVWIPRYLASLSKSLTESGISGWKPGRGGHTGLILEIPYRTLESGGLLSVEKDKKNFGYPPLEEK